MVKQNNIFQTNGMMGGGGVDLTLVTYSVRFTAGQFLYDGSLRLAKISPSPIRAHGNYMRREGQGGLTWVETKG